MPLPATLEVLSFRAAETVEPLRRSQTGSAPAEPANRHRTTNAAGAELAPPGAGTGFLDLEVASLGEIGNQADFRRLPSQALPRLVA